MKWLVTYRNDSGATLPVTVEARDSEHAVMLAGMKRSEGQLVFKACFPDAHRNTSWERVSVVPLTSD